MATPRLQAREQEDTAQSPMFICNNESFLDSQRDANTKNAVFSLFSLSRFLAIQTMDLCGV